MILVTGGLGMIGAHTASALRGMGQEVVVTSHRRGDVPPFLDGVAVESLDMTDREAFFALGQQYPIDGIVHLAGSIPGDDPIAFFRHDLTGLLNALDAARAWGVRRFAVASSIGNYIGQPGSPWHEELALPAVEVPHHIIAFKKAVEPLVMNSGVPAVILRIGSTWGPLMDPESVFSPKPPYISAVLRGEAPRALPADHGEDHCYAPDAGRAIALLASAESLNHTVYNVSSGRPVTNREFAEAVHAVRPEAAPALVPGGEMTPYLDISRLTADTGFTPAYDIRDAVADYLTWRAKYPR